ncbi:MAG: serine/threonine protein kinase, partial [Vicinamibacteraceae bacterium]|nr:serine/threonine protein kinase [Vicinamibacteraceae bacterium]
MSTLPASIGRYQVRDRLGQGGMGVLYLAHDPDLERPVAIKLLRVGSDDLRERFVRESRIAARLQHPHIVGIYDVGVHEGQPFIAMEFIAGDTLADLIKRRSPLSIGRKLALIEDLCEGLAFAHKAGVVHRDVKPANLMVNQEGILKILDFGIARVGDSGMTQVGVLMGTPNYMSPEQVDGLTVDFRSDIFAVGLVLYELLVYQPAFAAKSQHQTLHRILHEEPTPLRELDASLDPELETIVAQALRKRPEERYQDLTLLRADLSRLGQRLVSPARFDETVSPQTPASGARTGGTPRRGLDLSSVMRRRAAQIATHLEAAERAFERADLDAALAACEEAALLDPDEPRTMALIDRVRQAIEDRQVREFLAAARDELDHGSLTGARDLVAQALQMRPDWSEAAELKRTVDARFDAIERERQRQQQVDTCVSRARAALQVFAYEMAARSAAEALELDEGHEEARALRQQALEALEAQRREEAEERARTLVADAERRAATETLDAAIAFLERAGDDHALVVAALDRLRREQAALAARRADEEWVAGHVRRATDATAAGEFAAAREALDAGATRAVDLPDALASLDRARLDLEVAEAAAARAHAIARHLGSAREALAAERWDEAQGHVSRALEVDSGQAAA